MELKKRKIIAIVGPTASGKTAVAVKLAKKFNGEIVSADSRQVYRGLNLGTGKEGLPCQQETITKKQDTNNQQYNNKTIEQLRGNLRFIDNIPQWMIDICDPEEKFTLFDYLPLARAAIEDIFSRHKLPIIIGGTGLYVQALVEGFELHSRVIPHLMRDPETICIDSGSPVRQAQGLSGNRRQATGRNDKWSREQLDGSTVDQLQKILRKIDSKAFNALDDKKNPHRLIRAIEKAQAGEIVTKIKPDFEVLQIGLEWPRETLNDRIDRRVDERFKQGMLEEVIGLLKSGVNSEWLLSLGLEYKIITQFLPTSPAESAGLRGTGISNRSNYSLPRRQAGNQIPNIKSQIPNKSQIQNLKNSKEFKEMCELLKLRSHQYAKRQMTWFKRFPEIVWENDYKRIEDHVKSFLN